MVVASPLENLWIGRLRQGLTSEAEILRRIDDLIAVEAWVRKNQDKLVDWVGRT